MKIALNTVSRTSATMPSIVAAICSRIASGTSVADPDAVNAPRRKSRSLPAPVPARVPWSRSNPEGVGIRRSPRRDQAQYSLRNSKMTCSLAEP